ncbi:MAG: hypothetical protein AB9879_08085 [Methanothrix sp.]
MKRLLDVLIEMMPGVSLMDQGASSTTSMTSCKEKWMSSAKERCSGTIRDRVLAEAAPP